MSSSIIDSQYKEIKELEEFLIQQNEISFKNFTDSNFRKALLLSSASYYENEIKKIINSFFTNKTGNCSISISFINNKAIERQFHTYFSWKDNNANSFFGLFGSDFKDHMKNKVKDDSNLNQSIKDFMEIGRERNRMVHQDFGNFTLEKTTDEIFTLHNSALYFIDFLKSELDEYLG